MGPTVTGPGSVLAVPSLLVSTPVSMGAVELLSKSLDVGSGPGPDPSLVVECPGTLVLSVLNPPVVVVVGAEVLGDTPPPVEFEPPPVVDGEGVGPELVGAGATLVVCVTVPLGTLGPLPVPPSEEQ